MSITAGTVARSGKRLYVVVTVFPAALVIAPVIHARTPAMAGDVQFGECSILCGSSSISTARGLEPIGTIPTDTLGQCQRAASRCTLTASVVAKYSNTRDWSRNAANEKTACR